MEPGRPLEVRRRPRTRLAAGAVVAAALAGLVLCFVTTPPTLATTDTTVMTSAPVGQDVYVAVVSGESDRTLRLSGVRVHVVADAPVEVEPLLCVGGSPRVTSDPSAFCEQLVSPDDHDFHGQDTIVLRVRGDYPGTVDVDRVRLAFRDGVRRGTRPAGAPASISVLAR